MVFFFVEVQKCVVKDVQKKIVKVEVVEVKYVDKIVKSVIIIKCIERNKKKFVIVVIGFEVFDFELKKVLYLVI